MRRKSVPRQSTEGRSNAGPSSDNRQRKRKNPLRLTNVLNQIRYYQKSVELLVPRASFARVLREIIQNIASPDMRFSLLAIQALQESAETYLVQFFQDAYACTLHRNRVTLNVRDMRLVRFLRGPTDPGNL